MCITRCPKAFISGVGLKPYLSAGIASAAAVMFFEKRGRISLSAPLTGLLTVPSLAISCASVGFDCTVPAAGAACCACALAAASDKARAIQPNLFFVISFLLAARPSARSESILPVFAANNLVRKKRIGQPPRSSRVGCPRSGHKKSPVSWASSLPFSSLPSFPSSPSYLSSCPWTCRPALPPLALLRPLLCLASPRPASVRPAHKRRRKHTGTLRASGPQATFSYFLLCHDCSSCEVQ